MGSHLGDALSAIETELAKVAELDSVQIVEVLSEPRGKDKTVAQLPRGEAITEETAGLGGTRSLDWTIPVIIFKKIGKMTKTALIGDTGISGATEASRSQLRGNRCNFFTRSLLVGESENPDTDLDNVLVSMFLVYGHKRESG